METSNTDLTFSETLEDPILKTTSLPAYAVQEKCLLKTQISAPSYLRSLAENELPPFRPALVQPRPVLMVGLDPLMSPEEAIDMVAVCDADPDKGLKKYLNLFLVQKKVINNYDTFERDFIVSWMKETVAYAAQRDFNSVKLSIMITIYLSTHLFFKTYYWITPIEVWTYFKELMIRHSIEDSPDGQQIFEPEECYDIVTHFYTMYMNNLPLVHIATFGSHRLKLEWPFKK